MGNYKSKLDEAFYHKIYDLLHYEISYVNSIVMRIQHPEERKLSCNRSHKKNVRIVGEYKGLCICPKCAKIGYKQYTIFVNINTKHKNYATQVNHWKGRKYDYNCYIGQGKL